MLRASGSPTPSLARPRRSTSISALKEGCSRRKSCRLGVPARRAVSGPGLGTPAQRRSAFRAPGPRSAPGSRGRGRWRPRRIGLELGVLLVLERLPELKRRADPEEEDHDGGEQARPTSFAPPVVERRRTRRRSRLILNLIQMSAPLPVVGPPRSTIESIPPLRLLRGAPSDPPQHANTITTSKIVPTFRWENSPSPGYSPRPGSTPRSKRTSRITRMVPIMGGTSGTGRSSIRAAEPVSRLPLWRPSM